MHSPNRTTGIVPTMRFFTATRRPPSLAWQLECLEVRGAAPAHIPTAARMARRHALHAAVFPATRHCAAALFSCGQLPPFLSSCMAATAAPHGPHAGGVTSI